MFFLFVCIQIPKLDVPPVSPSLGPLAGGTLVTIVGSHLGIGSSRSVTMAGQPCEIQNPELIKLAMAFRSYSN